MRSKKEKLKNPAVKPFQATYYNQEKVANLSEVVCPPYDVIDSKKALLLRKQSSYNYCHISLAEGGDYNRPAKNLKDWLKQGVLIDDSRESYYLYQRRFKVNKKSFTCYGLFCLLNMEKKEIFPHEYTLAEPKKDRKKMLTRLKSNLSPIFVVAGGTNNFLSAIAKKQTTSKPFVNFKDTLGHTSCIWRIDDQEGKDMITSGLEQSSLVIADGHHRFETSFSYFQKNKGKFKNLNYILAYITFAQPGLVILPTHRIITWKKKGQDILNQLDREFNLEPASQANLSKKMQQSKNFCLGVYQNKKFYFASLKKSDILDTISPALYRELDSYVFHELVLSELSYKKIEYSHSIDEARELSQGNKTAFLLKSATLDSVFKVAKAGYRLPQKSTYFYPKILSGLVMRRFRK